MNDEWFVDTPQLRALSAAVREIVDREPRIEDVLAALQPHFAVLLADQTWLPKGFRQED